MIEYFSSAKLNTEQVSSRLRKEILYRPKTYMYWNIPIEPINNYQENTRHIFASTEVAVYNKIHFLR